MQSNFLKTYRLKSSKKSMKSKVTPEDVFLGSEPPTHLDFQSRNPPPPPPVRFSRMPSAVGVWIFSGITQLHADWLAVNQS